MNDIEKGDAQKKLDNYLFAYRMTPSTVTGKSPAKLFIGRELKSKLDLVKPNLEVHELAFTTVDHDIVRKYNIGDQVFIRNSSGNTSEIIRRPIIAPTRRQIKSYPKRNRKPVNRYGMS